MNATTAKTAAIASRPEDASISGTLATLPDGVPARADMPCEDATKELNSADSPGLPDLPPMAKTDEAEIANSVVAASERCNIFEKFKVFIFGSRPILRKYNLRFTFRLR
jgi:hypothetical protein